MEITKEFIKQKQQNYLAMAEKFREQYIAGMGAAEALGKLIEDMSMEVFEEKDITKVEEVK